MPVEVGEGREPGMREHEPGKRAWDSRSLLWPSSFRLLLLLELLRPFCFWVLGSPGPPCYLHVLIHRIRCTDLVSSGWKIEGLRHVDISLLCCSRILKDTRKPHQNLNHLESLLRLSTRI